MYPIARWDKVTGLQHSTFNQGVSYYQNQSNYNAQKLPMCVTFCFVSSLILFGLLSWRPRLSSRSCLSRSVLTLLSLMPCIERNA